MGRRKGFGKIKKPRVANFELIDWQAKPKLEPYRLLGEVREASHEDTKDAKIVLAYRKNWKSDVDGHLVLGKCVKASELQRELVDWDFVILLNYEVWNSKEFDRAKKVALLDHELCHTGQALDKDGEPKVDAKGRKVWRIVRHEIEEFVGVIQRNGCYKRDLQIFAETIMKQAQKTLEFPAPAAAAGGEVTVQ
jgi:hypothetical protein